ncbi:MAG: CAP domain-containing protein [bacterium]|nr:CAP domain-containing protein [bacterium]
MGRVRWTVIIVLLVLLGIFVLDDLRNFSTKYFPEIKLVTSDLYSEDTKTEFSTPPPLRSEKDEAGAYLTRAGIVKWTNFQRTENGLSALKENSQLTAAANAKVKDMFDKQYFAHVSPEGTDAGYFTNQYGYAAIAVGENLALGNFKDDQELVQAWMDSPGHRANILNSGYQEIGVAAARGTFEGKTTWLAVQIFGTPRSACPVTDTTLKFLIETEEQELDDLEARLLRKKSEIENTPKKDPSYNQKVQEYNDLVRQYNAQSAYLKSLIAQYNFQVRATNECISGF